MLKNIAPRPTFLIPSVLRETGAAWPIETYSEIPRFLVPFLTNEENVNLPRSEGAERWWDALEPLLIVLTIAGYDTPEIIIGHPDHPDQYLRLLASLAFEEEAGPFVRLEDGDWKDIVGMNDVASVTDRILISLRIQVRRWLEQPLGNPSPYPAFPIEDIAFEPSAGGPVAFYRKGPGSQQTVSDAEEDLFADTNDGWISFYDLRPATSYAGDQVSRMRSNARFVGTQIATALTAAWNPSGQSQLGLIGYLDPASWDSPLAHAEPLNSFNELANEIWQWLKNPANLEWALRRKLDTLEGDSIDASALKFLQEARRGTSNPLNLNYKDPFKRARKELASRHELMHPGEINGNLLIEGIAHQHWFILLFCLHEFGVIRLFPFEIADTSLHVAPEIIQDLPPFDVTGLYETLLSTVNLENKVLLATLQLNQAGEYLDGWLTDSAFYRYEFTAHLDRETFRPSHDVEGGVLHFSGTFEHDTAGTSIDIYIDRPASGTYVGTIGVLFNTGREQADIFMILQDRHARIRPSLISEALPAQVNEALYEFSFGDVPEWTKPGQSQEVSLTPLHSVHLRAIDAALALLCFRLKYIFELEHVPGQVPGPSGELPDTALMIPQEIQDTTDSLLEILYKGKILEEASVPEEPSSPLLHRFRLDAEKRLFAEKVAIGLSCRQYLEQVIIDNLSVSSRLVALLAWVETGVDTSNLDLSEHEYEFTMRGAGFQPDIAVGFKAELGLFALECVMQHLERCGTAPHGWPQSEVYYGGMFDGSVGVGEELKGYTNILTTGDPNSLWTRGEWQPGDFVPSSIHIFSVSLSGGATIGGVSVDEAPALPENALGLEGTKGEIIMFMSGSGRAISEISPNSGYERKIGIGAGGGYSLSLGTTLGFLLTQDNLEPYRRISTRKYDDFEMGDVVIDNFGQGDWQLTEAMRILISQCVARYRALLSSPKTILRIEGDASPEGSEGSNEVLSWKRALATYNWLRTLLGTMEQPDLGTTSALAPGRDFIGVYGNGELRARSEGKLADGVEDPEWRRVKLQINDQLIVFL